jgi:phospholipase/carboxylesterase
VPVAGSIEAAESLRAAGVAVELVMVPGLGHGIDETGLSAGALFLQRAFSEGGV